MIIFSIENTLGSFSESSKTLVTKSLHTHKLKRIRYKSGNTIFFCVLPDCSYKANIALSLGKRSICWRCNSPFILSEYSLRLAKPHCENCHQPKNIPFEITRGEIIDDGGTIISNIKIEQPNELSLAEKMHQEMQNKDEEI